MRNAAWVEDGLKSPCVFFLLMAPDFVKLLNSNFLHVVI